MLRSRPFKEVKEEQQYKEVGSIFLELTFFVIIEVSKKG